MAKVGLIVPEFVKTLKMTSQEHAYSRLRYAIMVGSIAPGVPVTIRGLADVMSVSSTPVREALRRLSSQNALMVLKNRRIVVPPMTPERFRELVSLRIALETHGVTQAIGFVSDKLIEELVLIDDQMDIAVTEKNREQLIVLNQEFHTKLICANPDQLSMPLIESIWLQLGPFMRIALQHIGTFYQVDRHKEVILALRNRDESALKIAIAADISDAVGQLNDAALEKILTEP